MREGIDLPEVSLIGILDADQEGFLRSTTALVQTIGRAARHTAGEVILYADRMTEAMTMALRETYRRRGVQDAFNQAHGITPKTAVSLAKDLHTVKTDEELLEQDFASLTRGKQKRLKRMTKKEKEIIMKDLKGQLDAAIEAREFEKAAVIRDQIKEIEESH
ncbi:MAG: UvrB/UvrC motif-containing protein [Candidatus Peribacteria bacterium]|nr:MAG: UvrB/UvrC motif-containing protein [Candidatus Peribacteria bacterium]